MKILKSQIQKRPNFKAFRWRGNISIGGDLIGT